MIQMQIKKISELEAINLLYRIHYRKTLPKLNKVYLGGFIDNKLIGFMSLGWGVRPKHTIKKIFPSLNTQDYFECGRLCLEEFMPKNSESVFISKVIKYIKNIYPEKKILFSWADGIMGKVGYVYQSANFLYGGFIWSDCYFSKEGESIHPRTTNKIGGRLKIQERKDIEHYYGKQFRYVYFLCSHKEKKRLISESSFEWNINYPKEKDLIFKRKTTKGIIECEKPFYNKSISSFSDNAKRIKKLSKQNFITDYAEESLRESYQLTKLKELGRFQYSALIKKKEEKEETDANQKISE